MKLLSRVFEVARVDAAALLFGILLSTPFAAEAHTVKGIVTDVQANPVANAIVWINQDRSPRRTEAAADGTFLFADVATGHIEIVAWKDGFACGGMDARVAGDASVAIALGEPENVSLLLLERRLDPRTGAPDPAVAVPGARVLSMYVNNTFSVTVEDLAPLGFPNPRSNESGKLVIDVLPKGSFVSFTVTHREFADQRIPYYPVGHQELTLQMRRGITLRGKVSNEAGAGVARARVSMLKSGAPPLREYKEALTDADGFYEAIVEPGVYFVVGKHANYASMLPKRVSVEIEDEEALCDIGLATARRISGRVTTKEDKPVGGVNVEYVVEETVFDTALTAADGSFVLTASTGKGKIHVVAPEGYISELGVDVDITVGDADVAMQTPMRITELPLVTGTVLDESGAPLSEVLVSSKNLEPQQWTVSKADGTFALRLAHAPRDAVAQFRAEHARRFVRADFEVALPTTEPQKISVSEFEPNIVACDPQKVRNDLAGFRDKPAPAIDCKEWFNLADPTKPVTLASLKGKVVVLIFWGGFDTTEASLTRIRQMNTLYELFEGAGDVALVGIGDSISESDEMRAFLDAHDIRYPVGIDNETATFDLYDIFSIPQIVLIDKKGVFRFYDVDGRLLELVKSLRREAA